MPGKREPKSILSESLEGVDRDLLYPAIRAVLENEDGCTRGLVGRVYDKLTDRDVVALLPAIVKAIRHSAPSDMMFADSVRLAGLDLLSRLHIREGMALCVDLMDPDRWGQGRRIPRCLAFLERYGGNARPLIPRLEKVREAIIGRDRRNKDKNAVAVAIAETIAKIEADRNPPRLVGLNELQAQPGRGR